jgi:sugar/nucleoside kinase (ribokinase family)
MYDIITIGSATRDVFLKSPDFKAVKDPQTRTGLKICLTLGTKMAVPEVVFTIGGGSINTAVGFARQGLKTGCIGRIGNDVSGRAVQEELKKQGVENLLQIDKEQTTAYSLILVATSGERTILEHRGANDYLSEQEIDRDSLQSKWLFLDSLAGNFVLLEQALDWAEKNNIRVAFNPGKKLIKKGKELQNYINKGVDIFIANEDEASFITGVEPGNHKKIFEEMDRIVENVVVMTMGPKGVLVSGGKKIYSAGVPDSPVIDRTGAGDAFSSGFVSGYIQTCPPNRRDKGDISFAIQLGTANATSVVQHFGAQKGLLKKGEWDNWPKVKVEKLDKN